MEDKRAENKDKESAEAWEVQDALLQGFQGLVLTFHVAAENVSPDHAAKPLLDHALASADQVISDARHRIEHLDAGRSGYSEDHQQIPQDESRWHEDE